jgi:hypothetical protein
MAVSLLAAAPRPEMARAAASYFDARRSRHHIAEAKADQSERVC